jgi:prepilin-type N-terminal cleavage/methylation domain-containing protein
MKNFATSQLARITHLSCRGLTTGSIRSKNIITDFNNWIPAFARMTQRENSLSPITSTNHKAAGFTLVELAIVIVIIGLILGGIIKGDELVQQANNGTIIKDMESYKSAALLFKVKYNQLPGDFNQATNIWGSDTNCPNTTYNTNPKSQTCNGDNNSIISGYEVTRFWQHLANSQMIKGQYTGVEGTAGTNLHVAGVNVPPGPINNSGYSLGSWGTADTNSSFLFPGNFDNTLTIGAKTGWQYVGFLLTPTNAYQIDTKIDDGKPGLGFITSQIAGNMPNCSNGSGSQADTAIYVLTSTTKNCGLYYRGQIN